MAKVTAVRTPTTAAALAAAIKTLWPTTVGGASPSNTTLAILVAQSALETGYWTNAWNNNWGNIAGTAGDYVTLKAYTGVMRPYRAYASLNDGVTAYLQLLHSNYAAALNSAIEGDLEDFVTNLKAGGYFEENEDDYYDALINRYKTVATQIGGPVNPAPTPLPWVPLRSGLAKFANMLLGGALIGGTAFFVNKELEHHRKPKRRRRTS